MGWCMVGRLRVWNIRWSFEGEGRKGGGGRGRFDGCVWVR